MNSIAVIRSSRAALIAAAIIVVAGLLFPLASFAQIQDPKDIPGGAGGTPVTLGGVEGAVDQIRSFMIFLAGAVVVIFLLWGGISYLTAGANEEKRKAAKSRMIYGIVGAAIIIGINVILATLSEILGRGGDIS